MADSTLSLKTAPLKPPPVASLPSLSAEMSDDESVHNNHDSDLDGANSVGSHDNNPSSGDGGDAKPAATTTIRVDADGRELSEYEIQRLERIHRNRQYLARLGLESTEGRGLLGRGKKPSAQSKKKSKAQPEPVQQRLSLRAKKSIDYSEPSVSVASLLRQRDQEEKPVHVERKPQSGRKRRRDHSERMEKFIYSEFQSLKGHKNQVLKQAERDVRWAEKEVKFWSQRAEKDEMREQRKQETITFREEEKEQLGGFTMRELLRDAVDRADELAAAADRYDEEFEAEEIARERELKRWEADNKLKTLDALDRFPRALKENLSLLNAVLLERAPKDPPPPRRSQRGSNDVSVSATESHSHATKSSKPSDQDDVGRWADLLPGTVDPGVVGSSPEKDSAEADECGSPARKTKRKRNLRNVGGWVHPDFAEKIDRSWLERDSQPLELDLSSYVPQVGETVLYYPVAHKDRLKKYPDLLGKKTRSVMRVPLWERAASLTASGTETDKWWTSAWIRSVDDGSANYPILCRVDRTYPEFPPDPYTKVVKKDDKSDEVQVIWKPPKDPTALRRMTGTPLRLAVELRPLTPVVLPSVDTETSSGSLALPPLISVVTFPDDMPPFMIPFSYAYALNHSIALNQKVSVRKLEEHMVVTEFATAAETQCTARLEEALGSGALVQASGNESGGDSKALEEAFSSAPKEFPVRDREIVLRILRHAGRDREGRSQKDAYDIVRRTLPLWNGICVMPNVYNRKKVWVSAWELISPNNQIPDTNPYGSSFQLDDTLRMKLDCALEDFAVATPSSDLFYYQVSEEDAPSYACAVPLTMSMEKVLRRLRQDSANVRCYYRGVDAINADLGMILDNCLLYNSPESSLVDTAVEVVSALKDLVVRVANSHFADVRETRESDVARRRLVFQMSASSGIRENGLEGEPVSLIGSPALTTLKKPYPDVLHLEWLQQQELTSWVPQAGDRILYSRAKHSVFLQAHYKSLEPCQCIMPAQLDSESVEDVLATVAWTRAVFPKPPSRKGSEDANTFATSSTLLALGLAGGLDSTGIAVVYWRPCLLPLDVNESGGICCAACGLAPETSFIKPATISNADGSNLLVKLLASEEAESIAKCFGILKRKCIRGEVPSSLDPELTKSNVKKGYSVVNARLGAKSLPSFEDQLMEQTSKPATKFGTRGVSISRESDAVMPTLVEAGFLPLPLNGTSDQRYDAVSPWPKLSLELVLLRLKKGYYRHKEAVENDIVEAYISAVILRLMVVAGRKKTPVSVKRIARRLVSNRFVSEEDLQKENDEGTVEAEELSWATQIQKFRELFGMALVSVSETVHVERLFGLANFQPTKTAVGRSTKPHEDPLRAESRQTVRLLLEAIAKDELQNTFGRSGPGAGVPKRKLRILCDGDIIAHARYFAPIDRAQAEMHGSVYNVKVLINAKVVSVRREVFEDLFEGDGEGVDVKTSVDGDGLDGEPNVASNEIQVKLNCDGKLMKGGTNISATALVAGFLGDPKVHRVVDDRMVFRKADFQENESLARFFFSRPGRREPCGRCQAFRRNFFECRVSRCHSNVEFDWMAYFRGGRGMEALLRTLHPNQQDVQTDNKVDGNGQNEERDRPEIASVQEDSTVMPQADVMKKGSHEPDPNNKQTVTAGASRGHQDQEENTDTRCILAKANNALTLANEVLKEAQVYAAAPIRFSKKFIEAAFPIDSSDGHYIYCIICGLSGNLLCCDGCPNVFHSDCVCLDEVPEGDWFCDECKIRGTDKRALSPPHPESRGVEGTMDSQMTDPLTDKPLAAGGVMKSKLPYGRHEFDDQRISDLEAVLESLNMARPERFRRPRSQETETEVSGTTASRRHPSDDASEERTKRGRGRPRKIPPIDAIEECRPAKKRRRGRPRKHDRAEDGDDNDRQLPRNDSENNGISAKRDSGNLRKEIAEAPDEGTDLTQEGVGRRHRRKPHSVSFVDTKIRKRLRPGEESTLVLDGINRRAVGGKRTVQDAEVTSSRGRAVKPTNFLRYNDFPDHGTRKRSKQASVLSYGNVGRARSAAKPQDFDPPSWLSVRSVESDEPLDDRSSKNRPSGQPDVIHAKRRGISKRRPN